MSYSRVLRIGLTVALLAVVGAFVLQAFPAAVGADYALTVQSGSMEPAIQTGAVVFVKDVPAERVKEGDVITYSDNGGNFITHRVIEKHTTEASVRFTTKGDANANADHEPVYRSNLVGVVMFDIPLIGYVVAFGNTTAGYAALVLVPVMLFIFTELWELWKAGTHKEEHT